MEGHEVKAHFALQRSGEGRVSPGRPVSGDGKSRRNELLWVRSLVLSAAPVIQATMMLTAAMVLGVGATVMQLLRGTEKVPQTQTPTQQISVCAARQKQATNQ